MKSASLTPQEHAPDTGEPSERYRGIRRFTEELIEGLSPEDCVVQSMPDASPAKWHLAHTTWFFETFLLRPHLPNYREFHPQFSFLFNSYYNAVGDRHPRPKRGLLTRPSLSEVLEYRSAIDDAMQAFLNSPRADQCRAILEVGLNHEQQHQELLLTDIKHMLSQNPLRPAFESSVASRNHPILEPLEWIEPAHGLVEIGTNSDLNGFCYDNETPRHAVYLRPFQLASRLVTNGEFLEFIDNGGYRRPELWLSDGWDAVQSEAWNAPLYWEQTNGEWSQFTLAGQRSLVENEPVGHVSFYEAEAFARWAGGRLPTEAEWEVATQAVRIEGNFAESRIFQPLPIEPGHSGSSSSPHLVSAFEGCRQMYGDVWEWTQSPYSPYPGYQPPEGALGEYNGKFMCNQFVLRGGSCATSRTHMRASYRNFFKPEARWQFSGLRLARDAKNASRQISSR